MTFHNSVKISYWCISAFQNDDEDYQKIDTQCQSIKEIIE